MGTKSQGVTSGCLSIHRHLSFNASGTEHHEPKAAKEIGVHLSPSVM